MLKLTPSNPMSNQNSPVGWVQRSCIILIGLSSAILAIPPAKALDTSTTLSIRAIVNSNADGTIQADEHLTLREAIALTNGTLALDQLSPTEQQQIEPSTDERSHIEFNLPADTTIRLTSQLPDLVRSHFTIDGTSQPGYITPNDGSETAPVVKITVDDQAEIPRGLAIAANNVTIRGLQLYGFSPSHRSTATILPAAILIQATEAEEPSQTIVIERNLIGTSVNSSDLSSAFGVSVFAGSNVVIRNNVIRNNEGSGIITGKQATRLRIENNQIEANGFRGMPDAIRLEGIIQDTKVVANQIRGNAGSGIFLFKPDGSVMIQDNSIENNGRKLRRAAIYLMGSGHQVTNNIITDQPGSGVVISAFYRSDRNQITHNRFARLDGLSIDLIAQLNRGVEDFQRGDGINPTRNSSNRRRETGNAAINAPQFLSPEFFILDGKVHLDGEADPGAEIELYRVTETSSLYGTLNEPIATTTANADGKFSFSSEQLNLANLEGERFSAIATHPDYGTSEPARNTAIRVLR
jgi:hypothetical protein